MSRRNGVILLLGLLLLAGLVWGLARRQQRAAEKPTVVVRRGDLVVQVEALGRVEARRQVNLSFPTGGLLATVPVTEGDRVAAGDVVAALDTTELETRLQEARLNLKVAEANLQRALAGASPGEIEAAQARVQQALLAFEAAAAKYDEVKDQPGAGTSDEAIRLEAARADLAAARAALQKAVEGASPEERAALEAQVELAQLRVQQAERALKAARLRAPFDGVVVRVHLAPGERTGPNQPVVTLVDPLSLRIVAEVDELDVARLEVGQEATVRFDAFPTRPVSGTVEHIAYAALPQRGSTLFEAVVAFEGGELAVRPGMNATVTVEAERLSDVLLIPLNAVRYAGPEAFVVRRRGAREEEVPVVLGGDDGINAVVLEGLSEGDVIVLP